MKKLLSVILAAALLCVTAVTGFAEQPVSVEAEKAQLTAWLLDDEKTEFDFTATDMDSNLDWAMFTLASNGVDVKEKYAAYIENAVRENFNASTYPSDLARVYLAVAANDMDVTNIGGFDLKGALEKVDYSGQTFLSSLYAPLLAMHYTAVDAFPEAKKQEIVTRLLDCQLPDGGFPYCTVDGGYGVVSDTDTTAMVLQALAPYVKTDAAVASTTQKALAYLQTQQADSGAYMNFGTPTAESTAQVMMALTALGKNPLDAAYKTESGNTPLDGIKTFIAPNGGAFYFDYVTGAPKENAMSTYQVLQALVDYEIFTENGKTIFTIAQKPVEPPTAETTTEETTTEQPAVQETTTNAPAQENVPEIPKTGISHSAAPLAISMAAFGLALVYLKKHD